MQSLRNYPKIFLLAMVMVFLLFTNLALGLLPASSLAVASPGPGWVEQTPFPGGQNLNAIDAVDSNTAWAVGDYGTLLKTSDGGQTWQSQNSDTSWAFRSIDAVTPSIAWVSGVNAVYNTSDGGTTWVSHTTDPAFRAIPVLPGFTLTAPLIGGLAAIDADTAWVTVSYDAVMPNPLGLFYPPIQILSSAIWKTADGGDTWSMQLYSLSPQRLGQIFVADGSTLWTAGFNLQDIPLVPKTYSLRSIDGGVTWISQDMGIQNQITSFSVVDSETAWAVSGDAWRTIDGGTTWVDVSPQLDQGIGAIAALNRDVAWAPYSLRRPNDYLGQTIKTTDGGQNWVIHLFLQTNIFLI